MVTIISKTNERRDREEMRRAHEQAAATAAARGDAEMGIAPAKGGDLSAIVRGALEAFGKPLAAKLKRMETDFAAYLGKRFGELGKDLRDHIDAELSVAVRDVRETHADLNRQAERIAGRAAERAVIRLSNEVEELRREVEALRAERANVRALR